MSEFTCNARCYADHPGQEHATAAREWGVVMEAPLGRVPDKTPMERDFPAICEWVRHQTVSTDALRVDLEKALAFLDGA